MYKNNLISVNQHNKYYKNENYEQNNNNNIVIKYL